MKDTEILPKFWKNKKKKKEPILLAQDGLRWGIYQEPDGSYHIIYFDPAGSQIKYYDDLSSAIIEIIKQSIYMRWYEKPTGNTL